MLDQDSRELASIRAETIKSLRDAIGLTSDVILLDFPLHRNFGDSVIWAGTRTYLRDAGYRVRVSGDAGSFDVASLARVPSEWPILFQGGGNFGDLYPDHENFRLRVISAFPGRTFVFLPQSIHFATKSALDVTRRALDSISGKATIFAREAPSFYFASQSFLNSKVAQCPDLAFGYDPGDRGPSRHTDRIVRLYRADGEIAVTDSQADLNSREEDWQSGVLSHAIWSGGVRIFFRNRISEKWPMSLAIREYDSLAFLNSAAAVRQLRRGGFVVTNRLHAHLLATLLGIPSWATDNSYGKISAVHESYLARFSTASLCVGLANANAAAVTASRIARTRD